MATASPALQQHFLQCVRQLADQIGDVSTVVDLYSIAQATLQRSATPALQAHATADGTRGTPNDVSTVLQRARLRSGTGATGGGSCNASTTSSSGGGGSGAAMTAVLIIVLLVAIALAVVAGLGWSRLKKAEAQLRGQSQGLGQGLQAGAAPRGGRANYGDNYGTPGPAYGGYDYGGGGGGGGGGTSTTRFPQQPAFAPLLPSTSSHMPNGFDM
jgi:hypothetical protein